MGQLVQAAIIGLQDDAALQQNANDSIWLAHDLLARFHSNGGFKSGFPYIDAEPVTAKAAEQLKQGLLKALERCASLATQGSLLWALIQTRDPNLKPLYIAYLKDTLRAMEGGSCIISSCLDGLNGLVADVYEWDEDDIMTQGPTDIGKNWRQARQYLARLNVTAYHQFTLA